jgi:hypothetical protein
MVMVSVAGVREWRAVLIVTLFAIYVAICLLAINLAICPVDGWRQVLA